ncbi:MAG: DNA mismatch repair protein MutS [Proteobacteria bacterium]|nr:DNA mismatch repair protein MutS [Pseudomonadota bacterium]
MTDKKANITPLIKQYMEIKRKHKDAILLFRMGEFYETFFEDANITSKVLNIVLTKRSTEKNKETAPPLAGFPVKAKDIYISKLVKAGYKVAICEQLEDPKLARGIVKRGVTEIITSGTILDDTLLKEKEYNYLMSVYKGDNAFYIAYIDISIAILNVTKTGNDSLPGEIDRISPVEIIYPDSMDFENEVSKSYTSIVFNREFAEKELCEYFGVANLDGFGLKDPGYISVCGGLLSYLKEIKMDTLPKIESINLINTSNFAILDKKTMDTLDILPGTETGKPSLLKIIDYTVTTMGARKLREWLTFPLVDKNKIYERQESVEELADNNRTLEELTSKLKNISDIERLNSKTTNGRIHPLQLIAFKNSLKIIKSIRDEIVFNAPLLKKLKAQLQFDYSIVDIIEKRMDDTDTSEYGGFIKPGFNEELDRLRDIAFNGKNWIANYQNEERERTGIPNLKIKYNNIFGYFIEISKSYTGKVPENYIRKQTLVNSERYYTEKLKKFESEVLSAEDRAGKLEDELYSELLKALNAYSNAVVRVATAISEMDCICSLSKYALSTHTVRPKLSEKSCIYVKNGRHPIVEKYTESFVPNDIHIDSDERIMLLTGPNMAGKSTYLREMGLIAILAQIGSFVPADEIEIGIFDRILTRIGASDDLSKGVSTFLAEMVETAFILHTATSKSLVLLDEIGRGTSTYDGMSIAWATIEYIHNNPRKNPLTVFATHYHELTRLENYLPHLRNYCLSVKEWQDKVIFLRKVVRGKSDRSYGIYVAKLAGIPENVIKRSNEILEMLEEEGKITFRKLGHKKDTAYQMGLFDKRSHIISMIKSININSMTPVESLNFLNKLIKEIEDLN